MSLSWPLSEPSQADYERLRSAVVATGALPDSLAAARFARRGLAGLIAWPEALPVYSALLVGAERPAWTPHCDPRTAALAGTYRLLLDAAEDAASVSHDQIVLEGAR
jgi:hypothetical protein